MRDRPEIVCICGSVRFVEEIRAANRDLTFEGVIVLAPGEAGEASELIGVEQKSALDALHLRKIDLADRILVVNPGGYIGESTSREIAYARNGEANLVHKSWLNGRRAAYTLLEIRIDHRRGPAQRRSLRASRVTVGDYNEPAVLDLPQRRRQRQQQQAGEASAWAGTAGGGESGGEEARARSSSRRGG